MKTLNTNTTTAKKEIDAILSHHSSDCTINFLKTNAEITNSYKIKDKKTRLNLCKKIVDTGITQRSAKNLAAEWEAHNFLYILHIDRKSAIDVNLDYECDSRLLMRLLTAIFELWQ